MLLYLEVWNEQTSLEKIHGLSPDLLSTVTAKSRHTLMNKYIWTVITRSNPTWSTGHQAVSQSCSGSLSQAVWIFMAWEKRRCISSSSCMVTCPYSWTRSSSLLSSASYLRDNGRWTVKSNECTHFYPPDLCSLRTLREDPTKLLVFFAELLGVAAFFWSLRELVLCCWFSPLKSYY